ncbi:MAG: hypothetical protein ABIJ96_14490 [Elusimicrobiota bacterium]
MKPSLIRKFLSETKLLRPPKKTLSTFGDTRIQYHLISAVDQLPNKTRLREGWVISERPKILTADALRDRFEGFGKNAAEFADWLGTQYQDVLQALEYRFKNQDLKTRVLAQKPQVAAERILKELDDLGSPQAAVIQCPDAAWSLALMRFTIEEAARSFPTNVRDLSNHGMFEPGANADRRRRNEVDRLFTRARRDAGARQSLGTKLREYGLFAEYEDRFLSLFR